MNFRRSVSFAAVLLLPAQAVLAAGACADRFEVSGNFLMGKTYKTSDVVAGISMTDAYARIYQFTAQNGFVVDRSDPALGIISAMQAATRGSPRSPTLTIALREEGGGGVDVAMTYVTPTGMVSPEEAIRRHFCLTIAAAAQEGGATRASGPAPRSPETMTAPAPVVARPVQPARAMRGFAVPTAEQRVGIDRALLQNVPNDRIRAAAVDAGPVIKEFIERLSCLNDYGGASALNAYAAPGRDLTLPYGMGRPMQAMRYHDKAACVDVIRIHGWSAPALNALRFEVVYTATDSGEVAKTRPEWVRQPDGSWLATGESF